MRNLTFQDYREGADYIKGIIGDFEPEWLLVLGSGLGFVADLAEDSICIPYAEIPHCPVSTSPGHAGVLVCGVLGGKRVAVMQGRFHFYEGYGVDEVPYLIRVARLLGAEKMLITNASGGINKDYRVGDLMLISDYLKFVDSNVLTGTNMDEFGTRFPDMTYVFTPDYRQKARQIAAGMELNLQEGVYCYFTGPQYETPAEIRAARILGADAAGMSTVPECIAAAHAGMKILGITLITNLAAGVSEMPLTEEEVLDTADKSKSYFAEYVLKCLQEL